MLDSGRVIQVQNVKPSKALKEQLVKLNRIRDLAIADCDYPSALRAIDQATALIVYHQVPDGR